MKFLVDANLPFKLALSLKSKGFPSLRTRETRDRRYVCGDGEPRCAATALAHRVPPTAELLTAGVRGEGTGVRDGAPSARSLQQPVPA